MACQELQVVRHNRIIMYYEIDIDMYIPFTTTHQGRHCCLWCLISADQLKVAPSQHGPIEARSTESITDDHQRFMADGGNIKKAKFFNNAIDLPIFPSIPLIQVKKHKYHKMLIQLLSFGHTPVLYVPSTANPLHRYAPLDCTSVWEFLFCYSTCWRKHALSLICGSS